jgi:hypothetical protein
MKIPRASESDSRANECPISTPSAPCASFFYIFSLDLLIQLPDDDDVTSLTRAWPCQRRCSGHAQSGRHTRSWKRRREGASDERLAWGRHGEAYRSASDDKRRYARLRSGEVPAADDEAGQASGDAGGRTINPSQSDHNARVPLSHGVAREAAQGDARPCETGDDDARGARPGQETHYAWDDGRGAWPATDTRGSHSQAKPSTRRGQMPETQAHVV